MSTKTSTAHVQARVPKKLAEKLTAYAKANGMNQTEALRAILTERFESKDLTALGYADGLKRASVKLRELLTDEA